ncbi:hypothetical protein D9M71_703660 [compost metagenome]
MKALFFLRRNGALKDFNVFNPMGEELKADPDSFRYNLLSGLAGRSIIPNVASMSG